MPTGISNGNSGHMQRLRAELREESYNKFENELGEDAKYWRDGALSAWEKLVELVGRDKADELTRDWDDGRTWKTICLETETLFREFEQETQKMLGVLVGYVPPEPETAKEAHAATIGQSWECPWSYDELMAMDDSDLGESPTETRSQVLGF